jgi:hypothetical protein
LHSAGKLTEELGSVGKGKPQGEGDDNSDVDGECDHKGEGRRDEG